MPWEGTEPVYPSWMSSAACLDYPQSYFFIDEDQDDIRLEKELPGLQVCRGCEVQRECLEYALRERIRSGLWGGKTTIQRRRLRLKVYA